MNVTYSSPNRIVWEYFLSLRLIVERSRLGDRIRHTDKTPRGMARSRHAASSLGSCGELD